MAYWRICNAIFSICNNRGWCERIKSSKRSKEIKHAYALILNPVFGHMTQRLLSFKEVPIPLNPPISFTPRCSTKRKKKEKRKSKRKTKYNVFIFILRVKHSKYDVGCRVNTSTHNISQQKEYERKAKWFHWKFCSVSILCLFETLFVERKKKNIVCFAYSYITFCMAIVPSIRCAKDTRNKNSR